MNTTKMLLSLAALAALVCGCDTIERAKNAQDLIAPAAEEASALADEVPAPVRRVSLAGYSLPDFVEFAYTNRPDVIKAFLAVSNAFLAVKSVKADGPLVPQISASGGYKRGTQNRGVHFSDHMDGDPWGSLDVDILICDFGRNAAQERAAREDLLAAGQAYREARLSVFSEVSRAYFTLLMNDALLEAAYTNQNQYASHLEQTEELLRNQEAKKLDVLRARLDLSNARHKMIAASNDVVTAEMDFLKALGLTPARSSRAEILPPASNSLALVRQELEVSSLGTMDGLLRARFGSPALLAGRARVRGASAELDYRIADLLPELTLGTTVSFAEKVWNWSWGSTVLQSIFTGYRKTTAVDVAVVALASAQASYEAEEQSVARDIGVALATRDTAREQLAAARVSVVQAKENLDTANGQLLEGDISRIDFSDAVNAYAEALGARVKAFYAGQMAEAEIVRLVGVAPVYVHEEVRADGK